MAGPRLLEIKKSNVLLTEIEPGLKMGDVLTVVDSGGLERAKLEVTQIKNQKAIAKIKSGSLLPSELAGLLIKVLPVQVKVDPPESEEKSAPPLRRGQKGVLLGLGPSHVKVNLSGTTSVLMTGINPSLEGYYQRTVKGSLKAAVRVGYGSIAVKGAGPGSGVCENADCNMDLNFFNMDAYLKKTFSLSNNDLWFGGGLGFILAVGKKSNIADVASVGSTQKIILGAGYDIGLSEKKLIPVSFEYSSILNNNSIAITQMGLKVGYAVHF